MGSTIVTKARWSSGGELSRGVMMPLLALLTFHHQVAHHGLDEHGLDGGGEIAAPLLVLRLRTHTAAIEQTSQIPGHPALIFIAIVTIIVTLIGWSRHDP